MCAHFSAHIVYIRLPFTVSLIRVSVTLQSFSEYCAMSRVTVFLPVPVYCSVCNCSVCISDFFLSHSEIDSCEFMTRSGTAGIDNLTWCKLMF